MSSEPSRMLGCMGRVVAFAVGVPAGLALCAAVFNGLLPWLHRVTWSPAGEPATSLEALWVAADSAQREQGSFAEPTLVTSRRLGWSPPHSLDCRFWVEPVPDLDTVLAHALCPADGGDGAAHWMRVPTGRPVRLEAP